MQSKKPDGSITTPAWHRAALLLAFGVLASCANEDEAAADLQPVELTSEAPVVTFEPGNSETAKSASPLAVAYRIIGKPVVGQPVAIDIRFANDMGDRPMTIDYRISDATALRLADSQPASLSMSPAADDEDVSQQVTVIPLREGRVYFNVAVSVPVENGSTSTVTAIPLQVSADPNADNDAASDAEDGD
jgi:hypothetical protein